MENILIPTIALLLPVFIIFIVFYFVFTTDYKKEKLKKEERIKAIEAGVEIPAEPAALPPTPLDYLRKGMLFLAVGLALTIGGWTSAGKVGGPFSSYFKIGGLILIFIGIALVIFYKIQSKSEE
jgi:uncharacterized membrane protein YfcA